MANCLVLGANGFIASHLVDRLVADGHFVRCFDRYRRDHYSFNHDDKALGRTEIYSGDFLNRSSLYEALDGIEYVFHFISTTNPLVSDSDPLIDIETNIRMSVELFSLCSERDVKKVIFASTGGAIYGNTKPGAILNEDLRPNPISPYGIGKLTIEHYLAYFKQKHNLDSVSIRISNPYGPRQNILSGQGVIPIFLNKIRLGEPVAIYGDGTMVRDYIFIDDLIAMIMPLMETQTQHTLYNIGAGKGQSINDLVKIMEATTGHTVSREYRPTPATFVDSVVLDTTRYANEFGIKPSTTVRKGIEQLWEYVKSEYET